MTSASAPLETALGALREALVGSRLPLDIADSGLGRQSRAELLDQIDDYLLPRLAAIDAPLLVVIGGSTGSGKSTLTNTLVGHAVSAAGVLRPTTRAPVLVCHPDDEAWFRRSDGVLADLAKVTVDGPAADPGRAQGRALQLVVTPEIGAGVAILDSPDIDSVEVANHELASQLLGAADMWLFVTTAARYADAVPWEYLKRARERAAALALVINRIPPGAEDEVAGHLGEMLEDRGLGGTHIFAIAEGAVAQDQLGAGALEVRAWLEGLAGDADARNELVRATLDGAVRSLPERAERVADSLDRQVAQATEMRAMVTRSYGNALDDIMDELVSGQLLRGEVIEQWQVHVGTGKFMRNLQRGVGRMRDRIRSTFTGKPMADVDARGELEQNLSALVRDAADSCAASVADGWDDLPGGSQVLDLADDRPSRASADLPTRLNIEIGHWQDDVLSMVRESAGSKVAVARGLSVGINTVGVALMVAVFSQTGGVTGGEAGVAAGTAAVSQTVLSAVFGEQAMRDLAKKSRSQLRERLETVLAAEAERFTSLLDELPDTGSVEALRDAAAEVEKLGGAKRRKGRR